MALVHTIGNKAEAAYPREDQFEKRRKFMEAGELFCTSNAAGKIVSLRG